MKKVFSIIAIGAMTLSLSSFDSNKDESILLARNCTQVAFESYDGATDLGYSAAEASQFADQQYDNCVNDGGEAISVEFL